jgi:delta-aminolevulinic acid dehydratase/porphobilinogen synthase
MVKQVPYLNIVRDVKNAVDVPVSVITLVVSIAMIKQQQMGWIDETSNNRNPYKF